MALAYKINKATYDALEEAVKGEYTGSGDSYTLDVTGIDLKAQEKFTAERDRRRAAEKRANDAESKVTELEDQYGDTKTTIENANKKITKAEEGKTVAEQKLAAVVRKSTLGNAAVDLANKLSKTAPKLLLPHIEAALDVDLSDIDNPKLTIKGADGKVDANMTLDKLEKNFRDNKDFHAIITATQASGGGASRPGGANGNGNPGTGAPTHAGGFGPRADQPVDLSDQRNAGALLERVNARRAARGQEAVSRNNQG